MRTPIKRVIGVVCILLVVLIWIGSSGIIQFVFHDLHFDKPLFITYYSTGLFSIYFCGFLFNSDWRQILVISESRVEMRESEEEEEEDETSPNSTTSHKSSEGNLNEKEMQTKDEILSNEEEQSIQIFAPSNAEDEEQISFLSNEKKEHINTDANDFTSAATSSSSKEPDAVVTVDAPQFYQVSDHSTSSLQSNLITNQKKKKKNKFYIYSFKSMLWNAFLMCPLWFIANVTFNYSLRYTSVQSNTILSSTSSLFTFFIGVLCFVDSFSLVRFVAVCLAITGTVLITLQDAFASETDSRLPYKWIGNVLSLCSAFMYGTYITFLKKRVPENSNIPMPLFFALLGCCNLILLWPLFFVAHFVGLEPFTLPGWEIFLFVTLESFIGTVLSDLFWSWSVLYTSSLVATLGLSLTIPLGILFDVIFKQDYSAFSLQYAFGALFIFASFFICNVSYYLPKKVTYWDEIHCVTDPIKHWINAKRQSWRQR